MSAEKTASFASNTWIRWTLATVIGFFITDYLGFVVSSQASSPIFAWIDILAAGLIIGALQWFFVFRFYSEKSQQWIWFTAIGWAIGWLVGNLFGNLLFLSLFVHGTILGFSQWFFYLRRNYPASFIWLVINALGLPLTYFLSWRIIFPILLGGYNGGLSGPADSIIRGILFGAITGLSVNRVISRSEKSPENVLANIS